MKKQAVLGLWLVVLTGLAGVAAAQGSSTLRPPLIPCVDDATAPCVIIASQPPDIVGVWKQYQAGPLFQSGVGYIRYNADGTFVLADTAEHTAARYGHYPYGTYTLENGILTFIVEAAGAPAECKAAAKYEVQVLRYGTKPVALAYSPLADGCQARRANLSLPNIWVGE